MWRDRIVGHGHEKPDQLLANPANWRTHPPDQWDQMERVLGRVGWVQRVIVNRRTGHMVDGHLRVRLALQHDEETVPVTYIDVSPAEEKLVLATFDPLGALASRDEEKLAELKEDVLRELPDLDIDLDEISKPPRRRAKGLSHDVKECRCCKAGCQPGCGCWRDPEDG